MSIVFSKVMKEMTRYKSEKIKGAMREKGFTIKTLAQATGLSTPTIWKVSNGGDVKITTLEAVVSILGLRLADLYDEAA